MKIAFYAPLKPPGHPVPSGDRLMARQLMRALTLAGHEVELASDLRARLPDPEDADGFDRLKTAAAAERGRLAAQWRAGGPPDLWFCYHPYYKSPDLIGPALAADFGIPWISAEASLSERRNIGIWAQTQAEMAVALSKAGINFALTARDAAGLRALAPKAPVLPLAPFLAFESLPPVVPPVALPGMLPGALPDGNRLVVVAMMRPGDKARSYQMLARALPLIDAEWELWVAGDGPAAEDVRAGFAGLPPLLAARINWCGAVPPDQIRGFLAGAALFVWPGYGEAYGLAYLEAQAAGIPVVACAIAGVPEVVADGESGLLVAPEDPAAFAAAVTRLLRDPTLRRSMGEAARARVVQRHSIAAAAKVLDIGLKMAMESRK